MNKQVEVGYGNVRRVVFGDGAPLAFIGGPCAIESREHALRMGERLIEVCERVNHPLVFKLSSEGATLSSHNHLNAAPKE